MTNHTPAPWVIDNEGDVTWFGNEHEGECECVAFGRGDEGIYFRNEADRALILAAPDMYEALVAAKAHMDIEGSRGFVYTVICGALKKARGEA